MTFNNHKQFSSYEGDWFNGNKQGKGLLKFKNGNIYEGDFDKD